MAAQKVKLLARFSHLIAPILMISLMIGCYRKTYDSSVTHTEVISPCIGAFNQKIVQAEPDSFIREIVDILPIAQAGPVSPTNFVLGMREFEAKNFSKAKGFFDSAFSSDFEELGDYILYYQARCLEELGEHRQAILILLSLLEQFPQSRFVSYVTLRLADNFFFIEDYPSARKYYQKSTGRLPKEREYIYFQIALSLIEEQKSIEAREFLKKIQIEFPASYKYGELSQRYLKEMESKLNLKPLILSVEENLEVIRGLINKREYEKALDRIKKWPDTYSSASFKPELCYKEAYCYFKLGKKDPALETLSNLVKDYPSSQHTLEALLLKGNILWNKDRDEEAIGTYQKIVETFGTTEGVDKAWYFMGRIYEQNNKYQKAIECLEKLTQNFPHSTYYPESLWRIGWAYYQWGRFDQAQVHFGDSIDKIMGNSDKHIFWYWQARAAEKNQNRSVAIDLYQNIINDYSYSYYTWWALQRIEKGKEVSPLVSFEKQSEISGRTLPVDITFHLRRVQKLLEYQLTKEALSEIGVLVEINHSDPHYWFNLGKLALKVDSFRLAVAAGSRCQHWLAQRGQLENYEEVSQLQYPLAYWDYVKKYASKYDLDPLLVCSLMRQESLFDPLSISSAQAYGLMQIIPSTAHTIASKIGSFGGKGFKVEKLYQPEINIAFGCWELADLLETYQGNLVFALASYNAGKAALDKWCRRYPNIEIDEFIEKISYKETRDYVKKVMRNYGFYHRVYKKSPTSPAPVLAKN